MLKNIKNDLNFIQKVKPLVLNITNYVSMEFVANSVLAIGGSPIMSVSTVEIEELVSVSNSLNINIGTLDNDFAELAIQAVKLAKKMGKPIILDPVGAGATNMRTELSMQLLEYADIVKGNASELLALSGVKSNTRGVDSCDTMHDVKEVVHKLALSKNCVILVTGAKDLVTDGTQEVINNFGHYLMSYTTGMGCALSAVIATFASVNQDYFEATRNAAAYFSLCGTLAAQNVKAPGSFKSIFLDELFNANFESMQQYIKII
jgi:hydroxyethylthiazole kinase